ncbi:MAG: BsaWI family type II restriction enzyme [Caldisericia bacterium]
MNKYSEKIFLDFKRFHQKHKKLAFQRINLFFGEQKIEFYEAKRLEYESDKIPKDSIENKIRQSWVTTIGATLEKIVELLIEDFCAENNLRFTSDKKLKKINLESELDLVKRKVLIHFDEYSLLPDGDIIIYRMIDKNPDVLAIISVKNSFRERYTETPYWKLKLLQSDVTKSIVVFMVTPDKDDEISFSANPRKARIVMEYELDGVYLAKEDFDRSKKIKNISELVDDLKRLV